MPGPIDYVARPGRGPSPEFLARRERTRAHRQALEELHRAVALFLANDLSREALALAAAAVERTRY